MQGASGAGKSTFLDLLAGKKTAGVCAGQILLGKGGASFPERSSFPGSGGAGGGRRGEGGRGGTGGGSGGGRGATVYVTQDDFHVAELTVRETLAFAVRLGMGGRGVT